MGRGRGEGVGDAFSISKLLQVRRRLSCVSVEQGGSRRRRAPKDFSTVITIIVVGNDIGGGEVKGGQVYIYVNLFFIN